MALYSVRQVWPFVWRWRVSSLQGRISGLALSKAAAKRAASAAAADFHPFTRPDRHEGGGARPGG